ncbi:BMC domain-containing protein (plasmid) [Rahnella aquatilis]|nr:BMC domain-containing protein [Rahnella aquatilis]
MPGQSLGLIETVGLAAAVEAADAAMKSAHVTLVGYELTQGGGMVTVKLAGEVGAVNAAVAAGVMAASKVGTVFAHKVIARTAQYLESMIYSTETTGMTPAKSTFTTQKDPQSIPVVNVEETPAPYSCMDFQEEVKKEEEAPVIVNKSQKSRRGNRRK